jgi:transaldolase
MRPENLKTKIFLDGGDPNETETIIDRLGFIDGQTTNPTLISKNPEVRKRLERGEKFSSEEMLGFYRDVVKRLSDMIPSGSISIEVYADRETKAEEMVAQAKEMFQWIPNAHIKIPCSAEGYKAASECIKNRIRVNMTLCFTQEQAAAVYAATKGASKGDVFVSPFVGRLDDRGENGMDLIANIIKMYKKGDGHVEVLTASVRNYDHFMYALKLGSDIITAPFKVLVEWADRGAPIPGDNYVYSPSLRSIPYKELDLNREWHHFDIKHELTDKGIDRFASDWNSLLK